MSKPRIDMHRLQDLVRLHRKGTAPTEVARVLGMSRKTERTYRRALRKAKLLEGAPDEVPPLEVLREAVEQTLPPKTPPQQESTAGAWRPRIEELIEKGKRPKVIYDVLCREHGKDFVVSYDAVYRLVRRVLRERGVRPEDVAIPIVTKPGLEAQVDFGYVGKVLDPETGRERKAWVFVLTLAHSRHMVARLVFDQSEATWLRCHVEAFEELGGAPEVLIPDNLKAAVLRRAFALDEKTTLNRSYRELARHYDVMIDPTPVRDPRKKGRVEAGVKYVNGSHFATRELAESDAAVERRELQRWVREVAGVRTHGTTRRRPLEAFEAEDRPALKPLPATRFELRRWAHATVDDRHDLARRARAATGLNQRAFARLLGVNAATVCAWERGGRNPARRTRMLLRLVCALPEQSMEVLLGDDAPRVGRQAQDREREERKEPEEPQDDGARKNAAVAADLREKIEAAVLRLRRGPRGVVAFDQLRGASEVSDVSAAELDHHLLGLEAEGVFALCAPLFPGLLTETERRAALRDPERGDLLFLESTPEPEESPDS